VGTTSDGAGHAYRTERYEHMILSILPDIHDHLLLRISTNTLVRLVEMSTWAATWSSVKPSKSYE